MSDNLPSGESWKAGTVPKWRPEDGPTAREIDAAKADLKHNLHQVIDDMVDGMAAMEKRLAEYEMELAAVRGAGASGIERFTTAHFDVAAISLVAEFIQVSPPSFTRRAVFVEDLGENGEHLEIIVRRQHGPSVEMKLVEKTEEVRRLQSCLIDIAEVLRSDEPGQDRLDRIEGIVLRSGS